MNVQNMRGKKQTFTYGNESLSITEFLQRAEIVGYLEKDGPLTYGSQREKLRKLLREGRINPQLVTEHAARNPTAPRVQDTRYGTQRRRQIFRRRPRARREKCIWTRTTTEGTQDTQGSHRHRRGELHGPTSIGAVSPASRIPQTDKLQRSPYTQRCERGLGRVKFQATSLTRNPG